MAGGEENEREGRTRWWDTVSTALLLPSLVLGLFLLLEAGCRAVGCPSTERVPLPLLLATIIGSWHARSIPRLYRAHPIAVLIAAGLLYVLEFYLLFR